MSLVVGTYSKCYISSHVIAVLAALEPGKIACLQTQDCAQDYGLDPSCDKVEPWGNLQAEIAAVCCLMRWQQQEKSHYDERETALHMISIAAQCIESV